MRASLGVFARVYVCACERACVRECFSGQMWIFSHANLLCFCFCWVVFFVVVVAPILLFICCCRVTGIVCVGQQPHSKELPPLG